MLDRQINLFILETNSFLTKEEKKATEPKSKLVKQKKELEKQLKTAEAEDVTDLKLKISSLGKEIKQAHNEEKKKIKQLALDNIEYNKTHKKKKIRTIDERYLWYTNSKGVKTENLKKIISVFESTLTRSLELPIGELTYDMFIVEIYYYEILQDLILNGFDYGGKHYVYFSSSAGQIRTKKAVFVEESKYEKCKSKLMCGLTVDSINAQGGMNINKFLAYLALNNSATDPWNQIFDNEFDIDRCIVVDDFETLIKCQVDNIDYQTYEITPGIVEEIPIPHTDGCGLILPELSTKNFMIRCPWIKGLLGVFDFRKFIEVNNCSPIVVDMWGTPWDIYKDNIQIILTKSQFKMAKYYHDWFDYKKKFKENNCEASVCKIEEDKIPNANINYQMLQTLYDASDEEITDLCKIPNKRIKEISSSLENALDFFKVSLNDKDDEEKNWFRRALRIYPELLTDPATKQDLRDLKNSRVKKYRIGKLDVQGKFTFMLPDLYAFCEWLFCKEKVPLGLLENGEVFCRLYKNHKELDCLRSPHLYIEHAVRNNMYDKKYRNQYLKDWFITDAVYTSTHDPISRILQCDYDGDCSLVLAQKKIIEMAKRVMQDVYPLYYEMKKANAEEINPDNLYKGLTLAFSGGNIGGISNNITKIWNSKEITEESKKAVKWLVMETNFTIDYAKTLFKPTRPKEVKEILKKYGKAKVPYFFKYAKDKCDDKVEPMTNNTINKIVKEIDDNKQMFSPISKLGKVDYRMLLKDKDNDYSNDEINEKFQKWNKKYGLNLKFDDETIKINNKNIIAQNIKKEMKEIEQDEDKVITSLVKYYYGKSSQRKKKLLWYVYGDKLYENLVNNVGERNICHQCGAVVNDKLVRGKCVKCRTKEANERGYKLIQCIDCGADVILPRNNKRTCRCDECQKKEHQRINRENMKKQYKN